LEIFDVTVDGTDSRIKEPKPFWQGWHSFKFNGPGLRYEVALCILTGDIVWIHGPFPCGHWPDIKIFRDALVFELADGEKVEADRGYRGDKHINQSNIFMGTEGQDQKHLVQSRHETVNKRLKQWNCLHRVFRHNIDKHGRIFRAVAVITQLAIENGEPLFDVSYDDRVNYNQL
jgi:DDE superfamily endonuclease